MHSTIKANSLKLFSSLGRRAYHAIFIPPIDTHAKIILPISMTRYDTPNLAAREKYATEIDALLTATSDLLVTQSAASVDVVCTAGLHNWDIGKIQDLEKRFEERHAPLLAKQTAYFNWSDFTQKKIEWDQHQQQLMTVTEKSATGSEWSKLMIDTHQATKSSLSLEESIRYQRTEYAAILSMAGLYTNIIYLGKLSPAWAMLYRLFPNEKLPIFTRAVIKNQPSKVESILPSDANMTIRLLVEAVEKTLTTQNFPDKQKQALLDSLILLHNAYGSKPKPDEDPAPKSRKP